jgi:hypothetical protein
MFCWHSKHKSDDGFILSMEGSKAGFTKLHIEFVLCDRIRSRYDYAHNS